MADTAISSLSLESSPATTDVLVGDFGTPADTKRVTIASIIALLYRSTLSYILKQVGTAASVTGTTVETTLATIAVPAGAMGIHGRLRISALFSGTNSANDKTLKVKLGTAVAWSTVVTLGATANVVVDIRNRGAANSQVTTPWTSSPYSAELSPPGTMTVDTTAAQSLTITGTLENSSETLTLEAYTVEVLYSV